MIHFTTERVQPGTGHPTAVGSGPQTFTLPTDADSDNDAYLAIEVEEDGLPTKLMQGSYVGATRVFTPDPDSGYAYTVAAVIRPVPWPAAPQTTLPSVSLSTAAITAIWDKATSALTTAGSIGKLLVDNINATISSRAAATSLATIAGTIATLDALLEKIRRYFALALRKDAAIATDAATEKSELNANLGSGAGGYDQTTDSQEAIVDVGVNVKKMNTVTVQGAGTSGNKWRG